MFVSALLWKGDLRHSWKCSKWPRADPLLFPLPKPLSAIWESPAVNPGLQYQTHSVITSWVSRTPEYTLSWVRYWVSYTNIKRRVNFPWIFSRNPAEETRVVQYQPSDCFLALFLESRRTMLMMSRCSLKGGCQKWLIWSFSWSQGRV